MKPYKQIYLNLILVCLHFFFKLGRLLIQADAYSNHPWVKRRNEGLYKNFDKITDDEKDS